MAEYGSNLSSAAALGMAGGTGTITAGLTTVAVAHGLGSAPSSYSATPITNSLGVDLFISSVDAANINVNIDFAQAADVAFSWMAKK